MHGYISYINAEALVMYGQTLFCTLTEQLFCRALGGMYRSPVLCGDSGKPQGMVAVGMGYEYGIYLIKRAADTHKCIIDRLAGSAYIYKKAGMTRPYVD